MVLQSSEFSVVGAGVAQRHVIAKATIQQSEVDQRLLEVLFRAWPEHLTITVHLHIEEAAYESPSSSGTQLGISLWLLSLYILHEMDYEP